MMTNDSKDQGREAFEAWWESLPGATGVEADKDYEADVKGWALMSWKAALTTSASALARDEVGELCARCNCWVRPSDDCNLCRSADDAKPVGEAVSVALSDERIIDIWCNTPTTRFGGEVEDQEIIDFARDEASVSEGWTSVEERLPKFPSTVLVAYESDADGEPCLDTGEAILHADGKWYGLGVFYALGREPRYEPRLTEKKVVCWKPMPSYSAPHATETVEMTDNSGWYEMAEWAVERWNAEVKNRPLINVHRRSLDDVWRQVIRHCGGDPDVLIGPNHDALLAASSAATVSDAASVQKPVATLHDDGHYTFHGAKPDGFNYAGWRMDVYATSQAATTAGTQDGRAAWDGDSEASRAAFREYDARESVSTRSTWQIWRDACAWQARAASSATAPLTSDSEAALAINLEGLREKLLTPRQIVRDKDGWLWHPHYPVCDEGTRADKFLEAFGIETAFVGMESDNSDMAERWHEEGLTDCSEWTPTPPAGEGWLLLEIYDTEDGPYALFGRDAYEAEKARKRENTRRLSEAVRARAQSTNGEQS
jgi:hypothetical protein